MTETNSKLDEAFDMIQTDPEKSLANFDEILLKDSKNVEAINGKASAYMKLNQLNKAEELFDCSMDIKPTTKALLNKGIIAKKREDYENALKYFNRANDINPRIKNITCILKNEVFDCIDVENDNLGLTLFNKEVNLLIKKGLEYRKVNKYWDSLECYESAIQKDAKVTQYIDSLIDEINIIIENRFPIQTSNL
ncbi:MAG: hypothetical protein BZ137_09715 [Methanosphaera sp. rholeuAM130]|nr:MAG: hypothetical protein BZ137_09715 [Methanosphaera sp. rholeuAM130]